MLASVTDGAYVERSREVFGPWLRDKWLPAIEYTVKPSTLISYRRYVLDYISPRLGLRPQAVTPQANQFYAHLLTEGRVKTGRGLSPATVRRIAAELHRCLRDATRWHLLIRYPADSARPPANEASRS